MKDSKTKFEAIVNYCLRRGFVFPSSEIYGGLAATYDFGPLGALMFQNIREIWIKELVYKNSNVVLFDGTITGHPDIWKASGHVERFSDPVVHDTVTGIAYRPDHLISEQLKRDVSDLTSSELQEILDNENIKSPEGNPLSKLESANLLVTASLGSRNLYLRGETCQNIFVQYLNLLRTTRLSIPFGVVQIGRVFRNEVTGRQFILRMREFEMMEFEFFIDPEDSKDWYSYWQEQFVELLQRRLGFKHERLRYRTLSDAERSHYAKFAADLECQLDDETWLELSPMNHRGDWDLKRHSQFSGKELEFFDNTTNRKYIPNVIETSFGITRRFYTILYTHLNEEKIPDSDETRTILRVSSDLAPYKVAILPLSKKTGLVEYARRIFSDIAQTWSCDYDDAASIGKRYRRHDEIGTPYCVTVDFESESSQSITVRHRDTMQQERVGVDRLREYLFRELSQNFSY